MADFQVVSNLGFSKSDQNELKGQKGVTVDFAYEEEGTLGNKAIRLFFPAQNLRTHPGQGDSAQKE